MKSNRSFAWGELVVGLLLIFLGIFTLVRPESTLTGAVVVYGLIAIVLGIEDLVVYCRLSRFTGFGPVMSLISGVLSVMCGVMLLANPNLGKWALTVLLPLWFIAHCISGLARNNLVRLMVNPGFYYCSLLLNIMGLVLGFLMLFSPAMSFVTLRAIGYMAAVYFILFGLYSVISAFAHKNS